MRTFTSTKALALCLLAGVFLSINSCTEDYFDFDRLKEDPFTWTPDLAFPLVFSTLNANDIITNVDTSNIYQVDADNFVTLIYRSVIFSQTINDFFSIPSPLPFQDSESLDAGEIAQWNANGSVIANFNGIHSFGLVAPAGAELSEFEFRTGTLSINCSGNMGNGGSVTVTYPDLTLNGVPLTQIISLDNAQNGTSSTTLADYVLDLNNNGPNSLAVNYTLTVNNTGGGSPLPSDQFTVTTSINDGTMASATGNFGQFDIGLTPDDVDIEILDNQQEGEITFQDPRLKIRIENSIGADIAGTINQLRAVSDGGAFIDLDYTNVTGPNFLIPGASFQGDTSITEWYFTGQNNVNPGANSNIAALINANYENLHYDFTAQANPGAGPFSNFATSNSAVEVIADVELPFWGTAENFTIRDTLDFPVAEASDFQENIIEALLRVNTLNGFPVDGKLKLYLTDSLYNITDSLLAGPQDFLVRSGDIDGNGRVVNSVNTNNDIELDSTRIGTVFSAKYIILDAIMNSTYNGTTPIRIYNDYELQVRLGFRVKLSASPSDINDL